MPIEPQAVANATIFFRDTGIRVLDADRWVDEDGSIFWQSSEFPLLITSADTDQEAVNKLVESAEEFLREVRDLGEDATREELLAAKEIGSRLLDGYELLNRREEEKRARARFMGKLRREMRGKWRHQFQRIGGGSPQISRV
jgi:hypothetical protein